jgi:hypothetical protein
MEFGKVFQLNPGHWAESWLRDAQLAGKTGPLGLAPLRRDLVPQCFGSQAHVAHER